MFARLRRDWYLIQRNHPPHLHLFDTSMKLVVGSSLTNTSYQNLVIPKLINSHHSYEVATKRPKKWHIQLNQAAVLLKKRSPNSYVRKKHDLAVPSPMKNIQPPAVGRCVLNSLPAHQRLVCAGSNLGGKQNWLSCFFLLFDGYLIVGVPKKQARDIPTP